MGEFATHLLQDVGYTTVLAGNAAQALRTLEAPGNEFETSQVVTDALMGALGAMARSRSRSAV